MINWVRKFKLRAKGIYLHKTAICQTLNIGKNTRIWAFVNICADVVIGENCNICDRCFIENGVNIGDSVTIKTGVSLWDGISIKDNVFIGPGVQFCNDLYPRSKCYIQPIKTLLEKGCSIGSGATILPGIVIGKNAIVGAGSVVTRSVQANTIVAGNPARIIRTIE